MSIAESDGESISLLQYDYSRLLNHLGRGGAYQYWTGTFVDNRATSINHWPVGNPSPLASEHIYFGVHPLREKPATGRGKLSLVAAINCLYGEFDGGSPEIMVTIRRTIARMNPKPTVVINSGGGYHCYWLLEEPYLLDSEDALNNARALQKAWVRFVGSDPAAADLTRVLRIPGTSNAKYDPPRPVTIDHTRWDAIYTLEELAGHVEPITLEPEPDEEKIAPLLAQFPAPVAQQPDDTRQKRLEAYALTALRTDALTLRNMAPETGRNNFLNSCALRLFRMAEAGWIDRSLVRSTLEDAARASSTPGWSATLRSAEQAATKEGPPPEPPPREQPQRTALGGRITITREGEEPHDPIDRHLTDLGNAQRLVERHGQHARYVPTWGKWLIYREGRWRLDELNQIHRHAQGVVHDLHRASAALTRQVKLLSAGEPTEEQQIEAVNLEMKAKALGKWAMASESRDRLAAMVTLAQHDSQIATSHAVFDADPFALAVANGVIDLRNGALKPHSPEHMLRSGSDVAYHPQATCPRWVQFLKWATREDEELQTYLQRIVGYTLTGDVSEQCYFFLYGPGANGKSTFVNLVAHLLGDLFAKAPIDMVLSVPNPSIPNDLARLPGKRMTSLGEMKTNRHGPMRFDEAKVKDLTGGDTITARMLHQEWFDYRPQFKLWIYGNHKPEIRGDDAGLARRTRLVPFLARLEEGMKDRRFEHRLKSELPGILNWAIIGCLDWQAEGLTTPSVVVEATQEYLQTQDPIGVWIAEACNTGPAYSSGTRKLYRAYRTWTEQVGEDGVSEKAFATSLDNKGFTRRRGMDGSLRLGIAIKPREEVNDHATE